MLFGLIELHPKEELECLHFKWCMVLKLEDLPSVEFDSCVGFNSEVGGVFEFLKKENIVDLDSEIPRYSVPDLLASEALISSWLADATLYELWGSHKENVANEIYFSDLPWPIGKILYWKQKRAAMQRLGVTSTNCQEKEAELYRNAAAAYESLSTKLGDQKFFLENKPTSLDAIFLGHALFVLQTSNGSSRLRQELMKHDNLFRYAENLKTEFLEASGSSALPRWSSPHFASSSKTDKSHTSSGGAKYRASKEKHTQPKTEEEKIFKKRGKYFLITQFIAVVVFLSLMGGTGEDEVEVEDNDGLFVED
ncbi:hypothetical protein KI387_012401 [Taxus chinensis]|uniref:Metaxin glutathione S-transferase domain-containing protein n=1 Tax=Taxus chinensis TaxID=29808 RepID=A0AA38FFX2_TAXCH|nr:hypothetical protein KI387_012401 [Taxus chinensis]